MNRLCLHSHVLLFVLSLYISSLALAQDSATTGTLIARAAARQIGVTVGYDAEYRVLAYPNGDVPLETGVCCDVVVRALRDALGVDLQRLLHEDMARHFEAYPHEWGLSRPDKNIDHRRVPNLATWFKRHDMILPMRQTADDYQPGDIVGWQCGGFTHIGIVSEQKDSGSETRLVIHNIGGGAQFASLLYDFSAGSFFCKLKWHARWK